MRVLDWFERAGVMPTRWTRMPNSWANLDADAEVFVAGDEEGVCNSVVAGEVDQVGDDEGVHAFLLSGAVDDAEAHFDVVSVGKSELVWGRASVGAVVPVDAQ
jgi:hypothetical protein